MEVDRNGLEILDRDECLRLLAQATVGRVGVTSNALPQVLPVTFRLVDGRIVFRTGKGTKLDAATRNAVVAFEVDDFDLATCTGWSVLVTGIAQEEPLAEDLDLPRWIPGLDGRAVAVPVELVSGRRVVANGAQA